MLLCYISCCVCIYVVPTSAHSQDSGTVYYGLTGYTAFSSGAGLLSPQAGSSLAIRFRACYLGGILLHAEGGGADSEGGGAGYFSLGVTREGRVLAEFRPNGANVTYQVSSSVAITTALTTDTVSRNYSGFYLRGGGGTQLSP